MLRFGLPKGDSQIKGTYKVENQPRRGLGALSSDTLCEVTPGDVTIFSGETETLEISNDQADPSPVTLRFGIKDTRSSVDYPEITLSVTGLSNISSVFKLATIDAAETPSVAWLNPYPLPVSQNSDQRIGNQLVEPRGIR
jgi:hypothetical protein